MCFEQNYLKQDLLSHTAFGGLETLSRVDLQNLKCCCFMVQYQPILYFFATETVCKEIIKCSMANIVIYHFYLGRTTKILIIPCSEQEHRRINISKKVNSRE